MTPLGFFGWWLSLWDLFAIAIIALIFRKKIVAFIKKVIDKFKKKQSATADTTTDATATTTTPDYES